MCIVRSLIEYRITLAICLVGMMGKPKVYLCVIERYLAFYYN